MTLKHQKILLFTLVVLCVSLPVTAYGQTASNASQTLNLGSVFSSQTVILTMIIVVCGVIIKTWAGMMGKSYKELNANLMVFTFVISIITGVGLVAPSIESLEDNIDPLRLLVVIAGEILTLYGSDSLYKRVKKTIKKTDEPAKNEPIINIDDFDEVDNETVPPGKGV